MEKIRGCKYLRVNESIFSIAFVLLLSKACLTVITYKINKWFFLHFEIVGGFFAVLVTYKSSFYHYYESHWLYVSNDNITYYVFWLSILLSKLFCLIRKKCTNVVVWFFIMSEMSFGFSLRNNGKKAIPKITIHRKINFNISSEHCLDWIYIANSFIIFIRIY